MRYREPWALSASAAIHAASKERFNQWSSVERRWRAKLTALGRRLRTIARPPGTAVPRFSNEAKARVQDFLEAASRGTVP